MKKIVALVLSLVMALSLCTVVFAATEYDVDSYQAQDGTADVAVKYVEQTNTKLGHYEVTKVYAGAKFADAAHGLQVGDILVETADKDNYDTVYGYSAIIDGKTVLLYQVLNDRAELNALKATALTEHKYVGCGDENGKYPADSFKSAEMATLTYGNNNQGAPREYWVKCKTTDAKFVGYVSVDGKFDNVVAVRAADVFSVEWPNAGAEVIKGGHLMVLVKENVEFKTSTDGKVVPAVNEYKCAFCGRTFYGSNYQYSTPETAETMSKPYASALINAGLVKVDKGTILGDVAYYWTSDKDTGKVDDTKTGVDSAKTFDAGVAMYVGMSLLSVAGGAVVIGKKKEF